MRPSVATFVYDGDTFLGVYEVSGQGEAEIVDVRYKQARASARAYGLAPDIVARVLLGELVRDDLHGSRSTSRRMADNNAA